MTTVIDECAVEVPGIDPADAVQIMAPGADHADRLGWLAKRRTGCGGSDISAILGLSKYNSVIDVWEEKTGLVPLMADAGDSEAAKWGRLLEPVVRDEYARIAEIEIEIVGMLRSQRWPWLLCDPDGIVVGERSGYEGKTAGAFTKEWNDKEIADHAELQAQACMAVTGFERWHVACLVGGQRPVFHIVERDDELISYIVSATKRFWHDNVLAKVPPQPDDSLAYGSWLDRRHPADNGDYVEIDAVEAKGLLEEHASITEAQTAVEHREQALTNYVKNIMGDAQRLVTGEQVIVTWRTINRFAPAKFRKAYPDLAADYTVISEIQSLDTDVLREHYPALYREFCSRPLTWKD